MLKKVLIITAVSLLLSGCIFSNNIKTTSYYDKNGVIAKTVSNEGSDYGSHTDARVEFKRSDSKRIEAQAKAITDLANDTKGLGYTEAVLYKVILADKISDLEPQVYGEEAPTTAIDLGKSLINNATTVTGIIVGGNVAKAVVEGVGSTMSINGNQVNKVTETTTSTSGESSAFTETEVYNSDSRDTDEHTEVVN